MTDALNIAGVDTYYGDSHVLHGVSFALQPGRLLGLLGRNGAGKTTCMNTVIGFLQPRKGTVRLFGKEVARLAPDVIARRGIALVPQGRRVFPRLTVRENLVVAYQKRGGRKPITVFMHVVLPAPLRPRSASTLPSPSTNETPCSTWLSP